MTYACHNCATPHRYALINDIMKVKCGVSGVREIPEHCSSWRSEDLLGDWPPAVDVVPKKYQNREVRKKRDISLRG